MLKISSNDKKSNKEVDIGKKIGLQWRAGEEQKEKRLNVGFFVAVNESL